MGLCAYTIGNGTLFWGLKYLPAATGSFLFTMIPLPVLFLGIFWLKEIPRKWQIIGVLVTLVGSALFFSPGLNVKELQAVGVVGLGVFAFAIFGILGRKLAKQGCVTIIPLTTIPLGFGGGLLLLLGLIIEGMFDISFGSLLIILWLVVVNTIIAYLLFYHSLRVLTALELHVLLNLSPLGTALLAGFLLNECLTRIQIIGMMIVVMGASLVQWRKGERKYKT
jgi:drug/metabolite transporter (DMT)-like permease